MALDLGSRGVPSGGTAGPPGLVVTEVADGRTLHSWLEVIRAGFQLPRAAGDVFRQLPNPPSAGKDSAWRRYVGFVAGRPLSTATLFVDPASPDVAGVYLVATVPDARGQGLGTALTLHVLQAARAGGHRLAVLQATRAGQDLYRRLGFTEHCTIGVYRWAPAARWDFRQWLPQRLRPGRRWRTRS
jgi:ribosomal protein S18 acetylase RimI-like enzyme